MDQKWIRELWDKTEAKLSEVVQVVETDFPLVTNTEGEWLPPRKQDGQTDIHGWTNGFWGGLMWLAWRGSKKEIYRQRALQSEKALEAAFLEFQGLHHDVGFQWLPTAVAHYKEDADPKAKDSGLHAATILAGRFNVQGEFIRAWNEDKVGWVIIDSMMNIPLLFWATEETGDPRFQMIAEKHADKVAEHVVRADGSVNHIVAFDPVTGEVTDTPAGQGYASGSSWSRGQAWAIYGFMLSYIHTGNQKYMDIAKRVAHYFIANLPENGVPRVDFRAPKEPEQVDTSAGAIAACGIIEIMKHVGEYEKEIYENAVVKLMKGLEANCDFTMDTQSILQNGSFRYYYDEKQQRSPIYGDYYLVEAILKLKELGENK